MASLRTIPIFVLLTFSLQAQQLSLFTQYRENISLINPAAIEGDYFAFDQNITFGASYRAQWIDIANTPRTAVLRGSYFHSDASGVALLAGGALVNDQTGPTGFTGFYGRIGGVISADPEEGGISLAVSGGMVQYRVDGTEIVYRDEGDIVGTANNAQFFPDIGFGLFVYKSIGRFGNDYVYGGVSVPQVFGLDLTFQNDQGEFLTKRVQHFYGLLGFYKFFENDSFLEPSVWVKYTNNVPVNVDFNLRYQMPSNLWIGVGGSSSQAIHLETGFLLGDPYSYDNTIKIGYGFDYSFTSFGPSVGTTHEVNLTFSFSR